MAFIPQTFHRAPKYSSLAQARRCHVMRASAHSELSSPARFNISRFSRVLFEAQEKFCRQLEDIDQLAKFSTDPWRLSKGNGGKSRVLQQGAIFEKAGVNVSVVSGILSKQRADAMRSRGRECVPGTEYEAAALSFVLHAQSPFVPTLRGDVRVFTTGDQFWAGGGVDLTIFYVNRPQIARFHKHWKRVCDTFDPSFYPQFKKQCDDYFYLPFREERRGVGGLFYDDVILDEERLMAFQSTMLSEFLPSFMPILEENKNLAWTMEQKTWQRIRRGRYLEFNLLEDRGVRFGLAGAPPSRIEAIMISAPPSIDWPYRHVPESGSAEEETLDLLSKSPVDWVGI